MRQLSGDTLQFDILIHSTDDLLTISATRAYFEFVLPESLLTLGPLLAAANIRV